MFGSSLKFKTFKKPFERLAVRVCISHQVINSSLLFGRKKPSRLRASSWSYSKGHAKVQRMKADIALIESAGETFERDFIGASEIIVRRDKFDGVFLISQQTMSSEVGTPNHNAMRHVH